MSKPPQCELCDKNAASVHFTEIADSEVSKLFICRDCAESRGLLEEAPSLEELMSSISKPKRRATTPHVAPCAKCGMEFADFQSQGRLGCSECYSAFESQLKPLLQQIHEDWQHAGKMPRGGTTRDSVWARVEKLQKQLDEAIQAEQYEEAAQLRDEIRQARKTLGDPADEALDDTHEAPGDDAPDGARGRAHKKGPDDGGSTSSPQDT